MNKKTLLLLIPIFLLSCSKPDSSKKELTINEFFQQLFCYERYEVNIDNNQKYLIDESSFKDINNNTTYYKYVFKDNYQKYSDVIIDDNFIVEESISSKYEYLTSLVHFFDNFVSSDDKYVLLEDKKENYQYLFDQDIQNIIIDYKSETLTYTFIFDSSTSSLSFNLTDERISPFNAHFKSESTFYKDRATSFSEVIDKVEEAQDFVLILTSSTCSHCKEAEKLYETFYYEFPSLDMVCLEVNKLNSTQTGQLIGTFYETYKNEDASMKRENYEEYPSSNFLTPTAVRYSNSVSKYVLLGFSIEDRDIFYTLSFD